MTDDGPQPIAVPLGEFLNLPIEDKPPLLGAEGQTMIVAGGLTLLGGQAGLGKTTLIVDAIFHMASGLDWLNFTVGRPLNILVIENEGPLRMFQQKLKAKADVWKHEMPGQIHVQTGAWGWFSFAETAHHEAIKQYLDYHQIDLVIGDPIGTLGMEGVGSPEDTRTFVRLLVPLGLFDHRAFWFPVHFTKEPRTDEINQISGAWGGHLDTLMVLKSTRRKDELRLSFPKLRWWNTAPPKPLILGKVYNTHTFEILREEGEQEPLEERIIDLLSNGRWLTAAEIANKNTGIEGGGRAADVKKTLETRNDIFQWQSGADHGRSAKAIVWALVPAFGKSQSHETGQQSQKQPFPQQRDESEEWEELLGPRLVPALRDESEESTIHDSADPTSHSSQPHPDRGLGKSSESAADSLVPFCGTSSTARARARAAITDGLWAEEDLATRLATDYPTLSAVDIQACLDQAEEILQAELGLQ